jgi:hypothetical protein
MPIMVVKIDRPRTTAKPSARRCPIFIFERNCIVVISKKATARGGGRGELEDLVGYYRA